MCWFVLSKIVVISEYIKDTFAEMDYSSEFLEIGIDHEEKLLTLTTFGHAGDVCISVSTYYKIRLWSRILWLICFLKFQIPHESEVVHFFDSQKSFKAKYRLSLLKSAIKAVPMSEKLSIRMDKREFLCLQYLLHFPECNCFLEYYLAPEEVSVEED